MDTVDKKNSLPIVPAVLGIKPADSHTHEFFRFLLVVFIVFMIYKSIYDETPDTVCLEDISDMVKPGSLMYKTIDEMDPETQHRYVISLQGVLKEQDTASRYMKSIQAAMIAGIATEYIVNGNLSKPVGIIAKTIMYSAVTTMYSLR